MKIIRTVWTEKPIEKVFEYLSDFTTTTLWDPGTVVTVRSKGDGGVGSEYLNTSTFAGRQTVLTYVVQDFMPNKLIRLRGENSTVIAVDTISFQDIGGQTQVTYEADFTFKSLSKLLSVILRPAFKKLGDEAQIGMSQALAKL